MWTTESHYLVERARKKVTLSLREGLPSGQRFWPSVVRALMEAVGSCSRTHLGYVEGRNPVPW